MMKKVLIAIAAIVVIVIAYKIISDITDGYGEKWVDNKITAAFPDGAISEPSSDASPSAEIYIDGSVSFKPYLVPKYSDNLIETVSDIKSLNSEGTSIYAEGRPKPIGPLPGMVESIIEYIWKLKGLYDSPFYTFFKEQAAKIDTTNALIYFVTDGIISEISNPYTGLGKGSQDMSARLPEVKGLIRDALKGHDNLAGAIFRYKGEYKGDYWNQQNKRVTSKECPLLKDTITRPYYVIVLGRKEAVRWLQSLSDDKLNNPDGKLFMGLHDLAGHQKAKLRVDVNEQILPIEDTYKDVSLILNLPECLTSIDPQKVKVMNGEKQLNVFAEKKNKTLEVTIPYDQSLKMDVEGNISISLIVDDEITGDWLTAWNTNDDMKGPDQFSTFSLGTLVSGMFEGLEGENEKFLKVEYIYTLPN